MMNMVKHSSQALLTSNRKLGHWVGFESFRVVRERIEIRLEKDLEGSSSKSSKQKR